jgi:hypothetical protein
MNYPGHIIKVGERDAAVVKALKTQLNASLALTGTQRLAPKDKHFGPKMKAVVRLFQTRNVDAAGHPLKQDGEVGPNTWAALFGDHAVRHSDTASTALLGDALRIAAGEAADEVREVPKNSNRGPRVEQYLRRVGAEPGNAWCCAFVYWCMDEAARAEHTANPMVKTAGCLDHWERAKGAGAVRILSRNAIQDPSLVKPGMIFIIDHGGGLGHTGFVERVDGGMLTTIEGNTDASKTREGGGVYRLTRRVAEINKGYIEYP